MREVFATASQLTAEAHVAAAFIRHRRDIPPADDRRSLAECRVRATARSACRVFSSVSVEMSSCQRSAEFTPTGLHMAHSRAQRRHVDDQIT